MHKRITFRGMDHSVEIERHAEHQLKRILEFLENEPTPISIDLVLEPSKIHAHHKVELRVKTPHYDRVTHYEGTDFYDVLDRVTDVMYRELREDKKREKKDERKMRGRHDDFKKER